MARDNCRRDNPHYHRLRARFLRRPTRVSGRTGGVGDIGEDISSLLGKGGNAMETIINLIIQLIAGVVGGNAAGAALKNYDLGNLGNTIAGAIGGIGGGQILQAIIPAIATAAADSGLDPGAILGQIVGGGAGGAILTVIAALVKNMTASQQTR